MEKGEKVSIRVFKREDLEEYVRVSNQTGNHNKRFTFMLKKMSDIYQQFEKDGLLTKEGGRLLITSKNDEILGYLSFFKGSPYVNGYEIGYQIFKEENKGKGYATEAVQLLTTFLFEYQPVLRLQICINEGNKSSERVALKANFTYEGTLRAVFKVRGKLVNNKLFSITREEWEHIKNNSNIEEK